MSGIQYPKDADDIVTLRMDSAGQAANTMNAAFRDDLAEAVAQLEAETALKGVILASAKKSFFAGGDLHELLAVRREDAAAFFAVVEKFKGSMRRLEKLGKPVVAAINGAALGGGWEMALICHHRIALNDPKLMLGLPEVTLGLLPGGGGIVRMTRLLGLEGAFEYLIEGKQFNAAEGRKLGLIHDLAETADELTAKARAWILANPGAKQPWDQEGFKFPGGGPTHPKIAQMLAIAPAMIRAKTRGCFPAPEAILAAAVEGAQVDTDTALRIESRYFTQIATGQVAKNMIGAFWFQLNEIKAGSSRPAGFAPWKATRVGVIGAGMMGAGIAHACASRRLPVVLKDVTLEAAEKGKAHTQALLAKRRGLSDDAKAATLALIQPTAKAADFAGCDLIIEAVFENRELKAKVTAEAETFLAPGGVLASNTSTLPITGLAQAAQDRSRFIGLHFFSPVHKMQLVEIIKGRETSPETLARAFDFVLQIGKLPIVVNDSRGFFTSRVFSTFVNEGIAMLLEGEAPAAIEMAALKAGMPVGPLVVADEVSLSLIAHIADQTKRDTEAEGREWKPPISEPVLRRMLEEFKRAGKTAGAGFYDYPAAGEKHLWAGLSAWRNPAVEIPERDRIERLLFVQALETIRCLDEGVLESHRDANIGSIFGIGFPPWTGGAVQYLIQYGLPAAVARAEELASRYGPRFTPPARLREAAQGGTL